MQQTRSNDIRSVVKAFQALRLLGEAAGDMGVVELSRRLQVHKSTASRLLATLERHGFVSRNSMNEKFGLGLALVSLAGTALQRLDIRTLAREYLKRLAAATLETVNLAILDGDQVVNIEKLPSPHYIRDIGWVGRRSPLHCTATGKALVADWSREERQRLVGPRLVSYTPHTICTWAALERELAQVRKQGYAVGREELEPGLVAVSAPVRGPQQHVVAAVSVSGPSFRLTRQVLQQCAREVVDTAAEISRALGASPGMEALERAIKAV